MAPKLRAASVAKGPAKQNGTKTEETSTAVVMNTENGVKGMMEIIDTVKTKQMDKKIAEKGKKKKLEEVTKEPAIAVKRGRGRKKEIESEEEADPAEEEEKQSTKVKGKNITEKTSPEKKAGKGKKKEEPAELVEKKTGGKKKKIEEAPVEIMKKPAKASKKIVKTLTVDPVEMFDDVEEFLKTENHEEAPVEATKKGGRGFKKNTKAKEEEEAVEKLHKENVQPEKPQKKKEKTVENKKTIRKKKVDETPVEEMRMTRKGSRQIANANELPAETMSPPKKENTEEASELPKKGAKRNSPKASGEPKEKKLKNATLTPWENIDFSYTKKDFNFKIVSWNVDGVRSWFDKDNLDFLKYENPDIFCIQETKCNEDEIPTGLQNIPNYSQYWCQSNKKGYAGVGLYSKVEPLNVQYGIGVEKHDAEGRCITAEYKDFYLVNVYVPNAGRRLVTLDKRLKWNEDFKEFVKRLDAVKPVIICGDMNVAHNEIDLKNPKSNTKNAGFTIEEREGMTDFLKQGFVDTFRKFYPDKEGAYTFWSYMSSARSKNVGWRLDYFLVSERFLANVQDNIIRKQVLGSDHCPITMVLKL